MKASIKLVTSKPKTINGYPVYLFFRSAGHNDKKRLICHSEPEHFNPKTKLITKQHPDYDLIIPELLTWHSKVKRVNLSDFTYDQAKNFLFKSVEVSPIFRLEAEKLVDGTRNGKLYQTVINSFNTLFADIKINDIKPSHAKTYMKTMLKVNSANGVHTYMRTLNALFNKVSEHKNPFTGVRPKKVKTAKKDLTNSDLKKLFFTRTISYKDDHKNNNITINYPRYYYMLLFYLGGIDMVDLKELRYDKHVIDGRLQFYRHKGGTNAFINNLIVPQALELLKLFDCYPYLVPIYKYTDYNSFVKRNNNRLFDGIGDLQLHKKPYVKSARYSFINRAQNLLIDQRITMEIVGHVQQSTHSIYTNSFPLQVRDEAHLKIIQL